MHLTASLKRAGPIVGALLVVAALLAAGTQRVAADDVNLCPADRPCITELFVEGGVLKVRWSGNSEKYHLRVLTAKGQELANVEDYEGPLVWGWTLNDSVWGDTLRVSVQGCTDPWIGTDDCTHPAVKEIALHAPAAPENVRLVDDTVHFDRFGDALDSWPRLRGIRKADGKDVYITHSRHDNVRSLPLPAGWRDEFSAIKICAVNPAGERCTDVQTRIIAEPQVTPKLPEKPATPTNFKGQRDGGFGTRIILSWNDSSTEEYYYLTAFSAASGEQVGPLAAPAPKLGAGSTTFIVTGDWAALVGGIEFRLQACNAGGCSAPAKVVVQ